MERGSLPKLGAADRPQAGGRPVAEFSAPRGLGTTPADLRGPKGVDHLCVPINHTWVPAAARSGRCRPGGGELALGPRVQEHRPGRVFRASLLEPTSPRLHCRGRCCLCLSCAGERAASHGAPTSRSAHTLSPKPKRTDALALQKLRFLGKGNMLP